MKEIVAALAAAYRTVGFDVQVLDVEGRKGHLLVTLPAGGTYRVDVLKEPLNTRSSGWSAVWSAPAGSAHKTYDRRDRP
jgi:hypothetical protein